MKLTGEKSFISLLGSKYPALVFTGQVYTNEIPKSITSVDFFPFVFFPVVRHLVLFCFIYPNVIHLFTSLVKMTTNLWEIKALALSRLWIGKR